MAISSHYIQSLPKAELHCHLLGVIHLNLLRQLVLEKKTVLVKPEVLNSLSEIGDKTTFKEWINVLKPYQQASWEVYLPILAFHINSLIRQHVVYTEIMISPLMFPEDLPGFMGAFKEFRSWVNELEAGVIQVEFIMVMPRTLSDEKIAKNTHDYIALNQLGLIVGVAIVGIEDGNSIRRFSRHLLSCKENGLGIEIHAGEHAGPEAVREALDFGFANRIGHGITLFKDEHLISRVIEERIHLEFCLTSNMKCGCINHFSEHPLPIAKKNKINFSISTDDPGLFDCSLVGEYKILETHFGFRKTDFEALFVSTMEARFQPRLKYLSGF